PHHLEQWRLAAREQMHAARKETVVAFLTEESLKLGDHLLGGFLVRRDHQGRPAEPFEDARQHVGRRSAGQALDAPAQLRISRKLLAERAAKLGSRDVGNQACKINGADYWCKLGRKSTAPAPICSVDHDRARRAISAR